jgi:thiol-disulfide isomerase/thioredoxin
VALHDDAEKDENAEKDEKDGCIVISYCKRVVLFLSFSSFSSFSSFPMVLVQDNSKVLAIGDSIPHFTLPAVDGLTIESHLIKDPVLVVVFTCNHCPYAKAVEDRLIKLQQHFDEEGVQFVLICSND